MENTISAAIRNAMIFFMILPFLEIILS